MAAAIFTNNSNSRLAIDIPAASITITILAGEGAKFAAPTGGDWQMITVSDPRTGQVEIMRCTARVNDILTVTRAQEGTTAQDFLAGATVYAALTAATIQSFNAGLAEAPNNGSMYVRQSAGWVLLPSIIPEATADGTYWARRNNGWESIDNAFATDADLATANAAIAAKVSFPEAPNNGVLYARRNLGWVDIDGTFATDAAMSLLQTQVNGIVPFTDAPLDGQQYARESGNWAVVTGGGGGGGVPEAPIDGSTYGRKNAGWVTLASSSPPDHLEAAGGVTQWFGWVVGSTAWEWRATPAGARYAFVDADGDAEFKTATLRGPVTQIDATKALQRSYNGTTHVVTETIDFGGSPVSYTYSKTDAVFPGKLTLVGAPTSAQHAATKTYADGLITALIGGAGASFDTLGEIETQVGTTNSAVALKAPIASPTFTGTPAAPTAAGGTNTTQLATTAFVQSALAAYTTTSSLTTLLAAKADLASPTFTGAPLSTTPATADNTTKIATTAYVQTNLGNYTTTSGLTTLLAAKADLASPALTGNPTAPTPSTGDNDTSIATTAFVQTTVNARTPQITVGTSAPGSPATGDVWIDTN